MIHYFFCIYLVLCSIHNLSAQGRLQYADGTASMQYGFSTKIIVDFTTEEKFSNYRLGFSTGVGHSFFESTQASLNFEYSVVLRGLGTYNNGTTSYFLISPHICQSFDNENFSHQSDQLIRNQPLYYFSDLINPPLQNPFRKSGSIGLNFIRFFNQNQSHSWQRVAHLSFKINDVQFAYNNDGGAILKYWGDREDRYFTGVGFLRIHLRETLAINMFALSFYKFTGFSPMSFEVGDEMLFSSVDYKDTNQHHFNRGFWSFQVGNSRYGDIFVRSNNPKNKREVQNFIHYQMGFGYHQNMKEPFYSFGGSLQYFNSYIKVL